MRTGSAGPPAWAVWALAVPLLWLGLRWFEKANLYFPSRAPSGDHPGRHGVPYEEVLLRAADGPSLHAWWLEKDASGPVVLFSHGNGGNLTHRVDKLLILRRAGASVLVYDYRGYGRSSGSPSEQGTYRDGEAAYRWLTETKGVSPRRVVLYGESLGCGVAADLALRHEAAGLVLESPFTSVVDMGRRLFPFLPVRLMVRFRYDVLERAPRLRLPALVMHSPSDDIVPYAMGRAVFDALPGPKDFFDMKGDHNEGFLETGAPYETAWRAFLRRAVKAS